MTSTSDGGRGHRVSSPLTMQYLQASGGGLSLERLLEVAHATGELVLTCRNLKSFPKHRCKNDLKDTVAVGKQNFYVFICIKKCIRRTCSMRGCSHMPRVNLSQFEKFS